MTVTKQREERLDTSYRQIQFDNMTGSTISDSTQDFSVLLQSNVTYPVDKLPSWKQRIKQHLPATTPSSGHTWKHAVKHTTVGIRRRLNAFGDPAVYNDRTWYTTGFPISAGKMAFAGEESEAFNQARLAFMKKARAAQTNLQGGVFVAELGKTIRSILRPAKLIDRGLKRYLRDLRRTRNRYSTPLQVPGKPGAGLSKRSTWLDVASDKWLETVFGILPLVSDLDGAMKSLAELSYRSDHKVIRGLGKQPSFTSKTGTFVDLGFGALLRFDLLLRSEAEVRIIGGVKCSSNEGRGYVPESMGFTLSNFLPSIWELIPYSFLVDYFTNLGDLIDAHSFPLASVSWLNETVRRTGIAECVNVRLTKSSDTDTERYTWSSQELGSYRVDGTQFVRSSPNPASLIPDFRFKVPGIGSTKWLNMAALGILHTKARSVYFR